MDTHITFVLDSSGSMDAIADDTRGGFNTFLKDQRNEEGTATVTLYDFNTTVHRRPNLRNVSVADARSSPTRTTSLAGGQRCTTPSLGQSTKPPKTLRQLTKPNNLTTLSSSC